MEQLANHIVNKVQREIKVENHEGQEKEDKDQSEKSCGAGRHRKTRPKSHYCVGCSQLMVRILLVILVTCGRKETIESYNH